MLKEQIIKTLRYFDIQDHPLTLLEIHKYLLNIGSEGASSAGNAAASLLEIEKALQQLSAVPASIETHYGFYFLPGRKEIAIQRWANSFYSTPRLRREKKYLKGVRHIPFVSAVAVTGSEALSNSKEGSDIDLFVLAKPNRIWLARLFLTSYFQLLGMRRYGKNISNRFCLNHYISEGKKIGEDRNIYTAIEYVSLIPYFGAGQIYEFQTENLDWIRQYLAQPQIIEYPHLRPGILKQAIELLLNNFIGNFFEKILGKLQRKRIRAEEHILVADDELSFHPGSKGSQVLRKARLS